MTAMSTETAMGATESARNQPQPDELAALIECGRQRDGIERRYHAARAAFIEAARDLREYGQRYAERAAAVPAGVDLTSHAETSREPIRPELVTADELDTETQGLNI